MADGKRKAHVLAGWESPSDEDDDDVPSPRDCLLLLRTEAQRNVNVTSERDWNIIEELANKEVTTGHTPEGTPEQVAHNGGGGVPATDGSFVLSNFSRYLNVDSSTGTFRVLLDTDHTLQLYHHMMANIQIDRDVKYIIDKDVTIMGGFLNFSDVSVGTGQFSKQKQAMGVFALQKKDITALKKASPGFKAVLTHLQNVLHNRLGAALGGPSGGFKAEPKYVDFIFQNNGHVMYNYHTDNSCRGSTQHTELTTTTLLTPMVNSCAMQVLCFDKEAVYEHVGSTHCFDGDLYHKSCTGDVRVAKMTVFWKVTTPMPLGSSSAMGAPQGEASMVKQEASTVKPEDNGGVINLVDADEQGDVDPVHSVPLLEDNKPAESFDDAEAVGEVEGEVESEDESEDEGADAGPSAKSSVSSEADDEAASAAFIALKECC